MQVQSPMLKEQLKQNIELARQLGVYDRDTFPSTLPGDLGGLVVPYLEAGHALVIAKTVQGIGLINEVHGEKSLVTNYRELGQGLGADERLADCSVREWGGAHFSKTRRFDPIHDRGLTAPYHVTLVKNGFAVGDQSLPLAPSMTLGQHQVATDAFTWKTPEVSGALLPSTITISQYLTLNALRRMNDLGPLRGKTRLPHYEVQGMRYYDNLPAVCNFNHVVEMGSEGDIRSDRVGIRPVLDILIR